MKICKTTVSSWASVMAVTFGVAFGCGDDDTGAGASGTADGTAAGSDAAQSLCAVSPGDWSAPDWDANAAEALALRAQLQRLTGDETMRGAEMGSVVVDDISDLVAVWDGVPSLAAAANPGYAQTFEAALDEFVVVVAAGPQDLLDAQGVWAPGEGGGIWGESTRGINEGGLSVRQLVDKASFSGGLLYAYAARLTEGEIDVATMDAIAAAWGANADLAFGADVVHAASYAYGMGLYGDLTASLVAAKAYAGDAECTTERDQAVAAFFAGWEQSMFARLVFYTNRAQSKLLVAATASEFADVLNDLSEGLALAAGFSGLPQPSVGPLVGQRRVAQQDVDAVMEAFGVDLQDLGASTTGRLLESLPDLEAAVKASEVVVMDVYGVDAATIGMYVMPTEG